MLKVTELAFCCYAVTDMKLRIEPMATPVCHMAMIFDPDGNAICIHKRRNS